jgi:uncharacterized membrane-anchored protein YjiN (DUF445 family)
VTEAAMVGGIADWFAVTALFKKPLGFPYHTAILPNRRKEFIEASQTMVQQEFFSRRTLFKKLDNFDLMPVIINYLEKTETKHFLLSEILVALKKFITSIDSKTQSRNIAAKLRRELENIPADKVIETGGDWLKSTGKDVLLFTALMKKLKATAATAETRQKLQDVLEEFAAEKTKSAGAFSQLMAGLAQMLNFVNYEEAAEIMQAQLVKMLDELSEDTPIQRRTLEECRVKLSELAETAAFKDLIERIQIDLVGSLPLEEIIEDAIEKFKAQIETTELNELSPVAQDSKHVGAILAENLMALYDKFLAALKTDGKIKKAIEKFLGELTARSTLYAQPLVGKVAKSALNRMTDEQLNSLVYDKAEPDFVWIRMNGSIVGSFIGVIIFALIKLIS